MGRRSYGASTAAMVAAISLVLVYLRRWPAGGEPSVGKLGYNNECCHFEAGAISSFWGDPLIGISLFGMLIRDNGLYVAILLQWRHNRRPSVLRYIAQLEETVERLTNELKELKEKNRERGKRRQIWRSFRRHSDGVETIQLLYSEGLHCSIRHTTRSCCQGANSLPRQRYNIGIDQGTPMWLWRGDSRRKAHRLVRVESRGKWHHH